MLWTGSDDNVQGVLKLLAEREVPALRGITNLGYVEIGGEPMWVVPESVVGPAGATLPDDVLFVDSGDALHKRLRRLDPVAPAVEAATAALVLPKLLELNTPEVILPDIQSWAGSSRRRSSPASTRPSATTRSSASGARRAPARARS